MYNDTRSAHIIIIFILHCNADLLLQYLGCIPNVDSWQSPESRSEFMALVDGAQVSYKLNAVLNYPPYSILG